MSELKPAAPVGWSAWLGVRVLGFIFLCKLNDLLCRRAITQRRQWLACVNVVNGSKEIYGNESHLFAKDGQFAEIRVCGVLCDEHLNQCKQLRFLGRFGRDAVKLLHVVTNLQNARNFVTLFGQLPRDSANRNVLIEPNSGPMFVVLEELIKRIGECIHDVERTRTRLEAVA